MSRRSNGGDVGARFPAGTALVAPQRILAWILVLASMVLSFNMTSNVMKDSLDRAEAHVFSLIFCFSINDHFILDWSAVHGQLVFNAH